MFTGTLIDELISAVERAEKQTHKAGDSQVMKTAYWYTPTDRGEALDPKLLGVA